MGPPQFVGTTVMGERGQLVIPKEVRDELKLKPGAKLVVLRHPGNGPIMLLPVEHVQAMMDKMTQQFNLIQSVIQK